MTKSQMGHVTASRSGDDMQFECECGATETVIGYMSGKNRPHKFEWRVTYISEHATCYTCRKEYVGNIGAQHR